MLIALDKDNIFLGFDVLSKATISGTETLIEATDKNFPIDPYLVKPKYDGDNWIEGASPEEIDLIQNNQGIIINDDNPNTLADTVNFLAVQIAELQTGGVN